MTECAGCIIGVRTDSHRKSIPKCGFFEVCGNCKHAQPPAPYCGVCSEQFPKERFNYFCDECLFAEPKCTMIVITCKDLKTCGSCGSTQFKTNNNCTKCAKSLK